MQINDSGKQVDRIVDLARSKGLIGIKDLREAGISHELLYYLHGRGVLERVSRGLYKLPDTSLGEHLTLAVVAKRIPDAVICLFSALSFHGITTQLPHQVWIARPFGQRPRHLDYPPIRAILIRPDLHKKNVEEHKMDGVPIRVYTPSRTVVDCFKFRSTVGLDVAIEALREAWRSRVVTMDELREIAMEHRMNKVMRPYMEAIV